MSDENITIGSNTGNSLWTVLMDEASTGGKRTKNAVVKLDLKQILQKTTFAAIETIGGLGVNPFLSSGDGHWSAPDGSEFPLSMAALLSKWPTQLRCMSRSPAEALGIRVAEDQSAMISDLQNLAAQVRARGFGYVYLSTCVLSGHLHHKVRESVIGFLTDEANWEALTSWTKYTSMSPEGISASERRQLVADMRKWIATWGELADEVRGICSVSDESDIDIIAAMAQYVALNRYKEVKDITLCLLRETEYHSTMVAQGVKLPWSARKSTRAHLVKLYFGTNVVSFLQQLELCDSLTDWNVEFDRIQSSLDSFARPNSPPSMESPKVSPFPLRAKEETPARPVAVGVGLKDTPSPGLGGPKCYNCSGAHVLQSCPQLPTDPVRRAARVAECYNKKDQKLGLLGHRSTVEAPTRVRSVNVSVENSELKFGIDSGLDLSLIRKDRLPPGTPTEKTHVVLQGLSGDLIIRETGFVDLGPYGSHSLGLVADLPGGWDGLLGQDIIESISSPTWKPEFKYSAGPLDESQLGSMVGSLVMPTMSVEVDSEYPLVREKGRPTPPAWREAGENIINDLLERGVITEVVDTTFGWVSPAFFAPKPRMPGEDLRLRLVVDYQTVNRRIVMPPAGGEFPHSTSLFSSYIRQGAKFFAKVDIRDAFFYIPLAVQSRKFLRCSINLGGWKVYEFTRGPQGLTSTPRWWCDFIDEILRPLQALLSEQTGEVIGIVPFMDDILVYSADLDRCTFAFEALKQLLTSLDIKFGKVQEPTEKMEIIGLAVSSEGTTIADVTKFTDLCVPCDKDELRSSLGSFQYVRGCYNPSLFVENISVLNALLRKNAHFIWGEEEQNAWNFLVHGFDSAYFAFFSIHDVLTEHECFIIQCDASEKGMSICIWISQTSPPTDLTCDFFNENCRLIATRSKLYSDEEQRYPIWDKEALAVFTALSTHGELLLRACRTGSQIWIFSDSKAAVHRWTNAANGKPLDVDCKSGPRARRWTRWLSDLAWLLELKPRFLHIPGENNSVADCFSRMLSQICGTGVAGLAMLGTAAQSPEMPRGVITPVTSTTVVETGSPDFDYSEFHAQVKTATFRDENDERYQERYIRDIANELLNVTSEPTSGTFRLIDGLLYHCADPECPRLYVPDGFIPNGASGPQHMRTALIALAHLTHAGVNRTVAQLARKYYWPRLQQSVISFIKTCKNCQVKNICDSYGKLSGKLIPGRFDSIIIDHCSLPTLGVNPTGGRSFRHILVIVDSATRYCQLHSVTSMDSAETIECLLRWSLLFGFPRNIESDNAPQLRTALIQRCLSLTTSATSEVRQLFGPANYPQSQGQAERLVQDIKTYFNHRPSQDWPALLPFLAFEHNTSGEITPHELAFGSRAETLVDTLSWRTGEFASTHDELLKSVQDRLEQLAELHRIRLTESRARSRDYYNRHHLDCAYSAGDRVWWRSPSSFGKSKVSGPCLVKERLGDHVYLVATVDGVERRIPVQHLAPYIDASEDVNREGIPFATTTDTPTLNQLLKKPVRVLEAGDLVLAQRGRVTSDVFEYDIGRVTINLVDTEMVTVDLLALGSDGVHWAPTGLLFTFPYTALLGTGFTLTKRNVLRKATLAQWRQVGIV